MKNNWIRFLAGALVSVMLVGAFALTGGMKGGKSTEGLLYQASGLHPDGEMLVVDGQIVTCEEYLYWVDYVCTYLASQLPDVDWNAAVSEGGITYGDYVKLEAVNAAKRFAVTRAWAEQAGIALTDGDMAALALQRQELVSLYGEEGYQQQLALMGISEETFDNILATQHLLSALRDAYAPGGSLYDQAAVDALIDQQRLTGVYVITLTGDNAETMAADLLERWQAAEDKDAEYQAICDELQQEAGGVVTLAAVEGDPLSDAIMAMELEELSTAIDPYGDGPHYYDYNVSDFITPDYPPTYHWYGKNDLTLAKMCTPAQGRVIENALVQNGVTHIFHRYDNAPHKIGPGRGTDAEGWIVEALAFWQQQVGE